MNVRFDWPERLDERTQEQIVALYNAVIAQETILGYPRPLSATEGAAITRSLQQALAAQDKHILTIVSDLQLIGMALVTPNRLPNCLHIAELSKGIIHPACRGRGVMEAALLKIAELCTARQHDVITLDVREHTKSHRLWRSLGFKEYGRLEDYARVGGVTHAGIYMYVATPDLIATLQRSRKRLGAHAPAAIMEA